MKIKVSFDEDNQEYLARIEGYLFDGVGNSIQEAIGDAILDNREALLEKEKIEIDISFLKEFLNR